MLLAMVLVLGGGALLYKKLSGRAGGSQLQTLVQVGVGQTVTVPEGSSAQQADNTAAQADTATGTAAASTPVTTTAATAGHATAASTASPAGADTTAAAANQTRDPRLQPAPDFTVYDAEGKAYKLSDFRGKPVVLNFWASWCPPCQSEMPDFDAKYKELGETVQFLMVNCTDNQRETMGSASAFIEERGYSFPVFYDLGQEGTQAYQAYSIPRTFFIDAEGYLIANALGAISGDILQQGIDMIR